MENDLLYLVEIVTGREDAPILDEILTGTGFEVSSYSNFETGLASTYVIAETPAAAEGLRDMLRASMPEWTEGLLQAPPTSIESITMRQEDWAESWKKHFHTFRASDRLIVKPSWEKYSPAPEEIILELDPGMCFGTGYHGTTRACLQFLDILQAKLGKGISFLDAGCGSGILSIGARLLGYDPVFAFDYDPQAVDTSKENLANSGFTDVTISVADVKDFVPPRKCRVVAANILAVVLQENAEQILTFLDDTVPSYLILSGILNEQYEAIRKRFTALGCKELETRTLQEWTSGLFLVNGEI